MYLDVVIENLQHNLTLNNLSSRPESKSRSGLCNCHACKSVEVRRTSVKANARKLDWMQDLDSLQAQFQKNPPDVIIACDCVYDPNTLGPLARVFLAALTAALPRRAVAYSMQEKRNPETHNQFLDALVIAGLKSRFFFFQFRDGRPQDWRVILEKLSFLIDQLGARHGQGCFPLRSEFVQFARMQVPE